MYLLIDKNGTSYDITVKKSAFFYGVTGLGYEKETEFQRIKERFDDVTTDDKAREMMNKKDKQRQSYYNYYSSKKWGRASSYDLCINSSILGIEGTVKFIIQYIEDFEQMRQNK